MPILPKYTLFHSFIGSRMPVPAACLQVSEPPATIWGMNTVICRSRVMTADTVPVISLFVLGSHLSDPTVPCSVSDTSDAFLVPDRHLREQYLEENLHLPSSAGERNLVVTTAVQNIPLIFLWLNVSKLPWLGQYFLCHVDISNWNRQEKVS